MHDLTDLRVHLAIGIAFRQGGRRGDRDLARSDWMRDIGQRLTTYSEDELATFWPIWVGPWKTHPKS